MPKEYFHSNLWVREFNSSSSLILESGSCGRWLGCGQAEEEGMSSTKEMRKEGPYDDEVCWFIDWDKDQNKNLDAKINS